MKGIFEVNTICRLCLRVDEKVYKIDRKHHKAFIESIIELKKFNIVPTEDHYVCYICNALIIKTYNFIQTIWNAQEIVSGILKNTNVITKPMLEHIERHDKGLNPITLSSVVIYEHLCGICEDTNPNTKLEEEINRHKYKENLKKETINEISLISSSDEDIQVSEKCYLDDVQVDIHNHLKTVDIETISGDPLEENDTNLKQKFAKDLSIEECEDPKPEKKKKIGVPFKKNPDSSSRKKEIQHKKMPVDDDYKPDSTSNSEESDYDSYDDWGRLKKPKDDRVYPRQCDHCDFEIPIRNVHYRHYQFMHPNIEYPYAAERNHVCSICGKSLRKDRIHAHEENHTMQKLKCALCPKVFPNKLKLYRHLQNVHPKRTYTCDYCSKIFKTRTEIYRHIRTHTGSKPFKCHICGEGFAHSGNRTLHIRSKHQNFKYVPKKKAQKVRKNKKRDSTDTEITCSDDESIRSTKINTKKKTLRKSKNKPKSADVTLKKKKKNTKRGSDKNRKVDCSDTAMVSEEGKQKRKKKTVERPHKEGDHNRTDDTYDTDMNIDQPNKNNENAGTESDDETLAIIKKKDTH